MEKTVMILLGISGQKGSGKDTFADALVTQEHFVRLRFAEGLKAMLTALLRTAGASRDEIVEMLEGTTKEQPTDFLCGATPRKAMQTLGTEWGRELAPNLWINILESRIKKLHTFTPPATWHICIPDVRFANEAEMIHRLGGKVVNIVRGELAPAEHASEAVDLSWDYQIENSGDINDLHKKAHSIFLAIRAEQQAGGVDL